MPRPKGQEGETANTTARVTQILTLMIKGDKTADIVRFGAETWGLRRRQIEKYITKAKAHLRESANIERNEQLGLALERYNDLYREMVRLQDYKGALAAQKEICSLFGLAAPTRLDISATRSFMDACSQADQWFKANQGGLRDAIARPGQEGDAGRGKG